MLSHSGTPYSFKIQAWRDALEKEECSISSITPIASITKQNGEPLFSLLDAKVASPEGYQLPHVIFIRGNAVITVALLKNNTTGEERFLMISQRRIGNGALCLEFPAGMIDREDDEPADVAVREVFEETGLTIQKSDLTALSPAPLYSSPGASDEAIHYFGCRITLPDTTFQTLLTTTGGNQHENEFCHVEPLTREEAEPRLTSLQAKLAIRLFFEHFCNGNE